MKHACFRYSSVFIFLVASLITAAAPYAGAADNPFLNNEPAATSPATARALYARKELGWPTTIIVDGTRETSATHVDISNCGAPIALDVAAGTSKEMAGVGEKRCGAAYVADMQVPADHDITTEMQFVGGMRLTFPTAPDSLYGYLDEVRAGGIRVDSENAPFLIIVHDGAKAGTLTIIAKDDAGNVVDRFFTGIEPNDGRPLSGWKHLQLILPTTATSIAVISGCVSGPGGAGFSGCNEPSSAPDGPVTIWSTVGPPAGNVAPRTSALRKVKVVISPLQAAFAALSRLTNAEFLLVTDDEWHRRVAATCGQPKE